MSEAVLLKMMVAGAALDFVGGMQAASAEKEANQFNAALARREAEQERRAAQAAAERQAEEDRRLMGTMRARMGSSGVDSTSGSAMELLAQTAAQADADYRQILYNGESAATALEGEASLYGLYGDAAYASGVSNAFASAGKGIYGYYSATKKPAPKKSKYAD